jgi:hypothetical protein
MAGHMEINRGKELQQLRTIRFIIVPPGRYYYLLTPTHIGIRNKNGLYIIYTYPFSTVIDPLYRIANKPRGLQAARKLRNNRRDNRWVCFPLGLRCLHYSLILCVTVGGLLFTILGG